jgi:hypothetical protein
MTNKAIEKICNNCKLYDPQEGICRVVVLMEGRKVYLPVDPHESCFFGDEFIEDVKEIKFWVENEKGEKIDGNGIVKIEYPID